MSILNKMCQGYYGCDYERLDNDKRMAIVDQLLLTSSSDRYDDASRNDAKKALSEIMLLAGHGEATRRIT